MNDKEARELAEAHWHFVEQILLRELEQKHFLYVEAMVHGIKHGQDATPKSLSGGEK